MRVTTNMIMDRTIFNLAQNLNRYMNIQSQLSSGRRINLPSDDPIGTQHSLAFRSRLKQIEQYQANINGGLGTLGVYENTLTDLNDYYLTAKGVALQMANDSNTGEEGAWRASANEVRSILDQVIRLSNMQYKEKYIFSGHLSRTQSFSLATNGAVYRGDLGTIDLEIEVGSRIQSNLVGQNLFLKQLAILGEGQNLEVGIDGATLIADLNHGNGIDTAGGTFEVVDNNLSNPVVTIDVNVPSAPITVNDLITNINTQLTAAGSNIQVGIADAGAALKWIPTVPATNSVSDSTPLSNLNGGTGVFDSPQEIRIHNFNDSIDFTINLEGASTLGDVISMIQADLDSHLGTGTVTVGYNADGTGLQFTDNSGLSLNLQVDDVSKAAHTASDLGIVGTIGPTLVGDNLSPLPDFSVTDIGIQTIAADLGLLGRIQNEQVGKSIQPRLLTTTSLSLLNNKAGLTMGNIKISQGDKTAFVNLAGAVTVGDVLNALNSTVLDITASINLDENGIRVESNLPSATLIIENSDETATASFLGIDGSPDMIGSLIMLCNALENKDRDMVEKLVGNMDEAMAELLSVRGTVGTRMDIMQTTRNRLESDNVNVTRLLSDTEDADVVSLVSELAKEENLYQAALLASSKTMTMSLVDFLR